MLHKELITQLKKFRTIEPDLVYTKTSRSVIVTTQKPAFALPQFFWKHAATSAFVIIIAFVLSLYALTLSRPSISASLDPKSLENEFQNMTINIQLEEISYQQEANQAIASALDEIQNTSVRHLNNSLIRSEEENIKLDEATNPYIDELLNSVIF